MKKILGILSAILILSSIVHAADVKVTALTENTAPLSTDLTYLVDDPGGTPVSNKITLTNLLGAPEPSTAWASTDTTPDISADRMFRTANASATTITDFDWGAGGATDGDRFCVHINDANTVFDFTASGLEGIGADYTATDGEVLCWYYDGTDSQWHVSTSPEVFETLATNGIVVNNNGTPVSKEFIVILKLFAIGDAVTTGDGKNCFTIDPNLTGMNLTSVGLHAYTASTSGLPTVQVRNQTDTADMLSTLLTLDANEKDSSTATTAAVINTATDDVVTGDEICGDVDIAGTGTIGAELRLGFNLP